MDNCQLEMARGELDKKLWSKLPEELLELVLRCLPLLSLCKFRAVSKHWNKLPTVRPEDPYYLNIPIFFTPACLRRASIYNLSNNKWDVLDLSFLHSNMAQLCSLQYPWHLKMEHCCSDGGLLCLRMKFASQRLGRLFSPTRYGFFVCNPLTRTCKHLLAYCSFEQHTCIDVVMHKDQSSGGYKIFAVTANYINQHAGFIRRHFMYDSASDAWKLILDSNQDSCNDMYSLSKCCSIVFEGVYYYCVSGGLQQAYKVFAYDIQQDTWIAAGVKVKLYPRPRLKVLFVVSSNRLLLIGSSVEKNSLVFMISRINLCKMDDLVETVVLPTNSSWNHNTVALACKDSIILLAKTLASNDQFVAHVKLGSGVKELKLVNIRERHENGLNVSATTSFDLQATV